MAGETIDIYLHCNRERKITAKKIAESGEYELFTEENIFDKLSSAQKRQINKALITVSKQYGKLFDIYSLCDKRNDNKLKVVLLSDKYKKYRRVNKSNGFIYRGRNKDKDKDKNKNIIYVNTAGILREDNKKNGSIKKEMERMLRHETIHTIINDNVRNGKIKKAPVLWLEEGLAESSNLINGYNEFCATSTDMALKSKYHFSTNLIKYL